jgi:endonuclease/exonuclease/phosphatase family metal-dependent hydrolase
MSLGIFILNTFFSIAVVTACGKHSNDRYSLQQSDSTLRFLFYNVENLFEPSNDSLTDDDDFTPAGDLHWTWSRYQDKLNKISKVIIAAGQWEIPAVVGLCEIENKKTLDELIFHTPLSAYSYRIIHKDSPDRRGIDVALLYDSKKLRAVESRFFPVSHGSTTSRDILYVKLLAGKLPFHVFVNHWPSRSEGQLESEVKRIAAAAVLKHVTDSIFLNNPLANLIIMGDFNDEPNDKSIAEILQCRKLPHRDNSRLVNLTIAPVKGNVKGTLKYQGEWNVFDQIMVSANLLNGTNGLSVADNGFQILNNPFLLQRDMSYTGYKPFRTYIGFRYIGGFSDHLPVYTDVVLTNQ